MHRFYIKLKLMKPMWQSFSKKTFHIKLIEHVNVHRYELLNFSLFWLLYSLSMFQRSIKVLFTLDLFVAPKTNRDGYSYSHTLLFILNNWINYLCWIPGESRSVRTIYTNQACSELASQAPPPVIGKLVKWNGNHDHNPIQKLLKLL